MRWTKAMKGRHIRLLPTQILVLGFAVIILAGALLLSLPTASANGRSMGFANALFEATSAVCVTGLVVVNTAYDLSIFGQIVIMLLVQIGGLGFMTMAAMVFLLIGKRITLKERLVMQEALNYYSLEGIVRLTKNIIITTFMIEGIGALLLALRFIPMFGWTKGIYFSVFHAISAFCNAGFDLFGNSLIDFTDDIIINFTLMGLIVLGGLGFTVINDLRVNRFSFKKWSLHTKLVIVGASPVSTGGGIKTTTAVVILLMLKSVAKGENDVMAFKRRISTETVYRAVSISLISIAALGFVTMVISVIDDFNFIDLLLEAAAALSTTGLTTFDNAQMKMISKIIIIISMYMGRVGPLTLTLAFARLQSQKKASIRYPESKVMVG